MESGETGLNIGDSVAVGTLDTEGVLVVLDGLVNEETDSVGLSEVVSVIDVDDIGEAWKVAESVMDCEAALLTDHVIVRRKDSRSHRRDGFDINVDIKVLLVCARVRHYSAPSLSEWVLQRGERRGRLVVCSGFP